MFAFVLLKGFLQFGGACSTAIGGGGAASLLQPTRARAMHRMEFALPNNVNVIRNYAAVGDLIWLELGLFERFIAGVPTIVNALVIVELDPGYVAGHPKRVTNPVVAVPFPFEFKTIVK